MKAPVLELAVTVVLAVVVGAVGIVIGGGWGLTLGGGALYLVFTALFDFLGFGLWRRRHADEQGGATMSSPMRPIGPFQTEDRAEAMGCVSGCFIYVFGVVLAVAAGAAVQAVWHTNWLTLAVGALVLAGGCWLGSRLWPRVERCMPDPYPEDNKDDDGHT